MARDQALHHLQHRRDEFRLRGQQQTQRYRQRPLPRSQRNMWDDVVHQVRRARHDGHDPRRLQLKASSLYWPHSPHRSLRTP